jgi:hypothetical protein
MTDLIVPIVCGLIAAVVLICLVRDAAREMYDEGYAKGRLDADAWWKRIESEADQARQQIWREEGSKQ